jgi:hypothetical protein
MLVTLLSTCTGIVSIGSTPRPGLAQIRYFNLVVLRIGTVKWGNTVIGINIVTSLPKFLTGYYSRTNELISLA